MKNGRTPNVGIEGAQKSRCLILGAFDFLPCFFVGRQSLVVRGRFLETSARSATRSILTPI